MRALLILSLLTADVYAAPDWPGVAYSEVRGYAYNKRGLVGTSILRKGRLAPSVINKRGVVLTAEQTQRVILAVTGRTPGIREPEYCFQPHHAFIFYDTAKKPVAWVELSSVCGSAEASPRPNGPPINVLALDAIVKKLKLPPFP
jgi:hypothetical protein